MDKKVLVYDSTDRNGDNILKIWWLPYSLRKEKQDSLVATIYPYIDKPISFSMKEWEALDIIAGLTNALLYAKDRKHWKSKQ